MNFKQRNWLKVGLKTATHASKVMLAAKESPAKAIQAVFEGATDIAEEIDKFRDDPFIASGWHRLHLGSVADCICGILEDHPRVESVFANEWMRSIAFKFPELEGRIGFRITSYRVDGPYLEFVEDSSRCYGAMGEMIWAELGPRITARVSFENGFELRKDTLSESMPSPLSEELSVYIKAFREAGHSRGVLLVGKPGVGKSWATREIIKSLGGRSLRMEVDQIENAREIIELLLILKPDAFLIDDMDQSRAFSSLMSRWEAVRQSTKVVLATANNLDLFEPAMLRAGRFDRIIEVEPDERLITTMLANVPKSFHERAKNLAPAYLSELQKSIAVEGPETALKRLEALEEVQRRLSDDGGDVDSEEAKGVDTANLKRG